MSRVHLIQPERTYKIENGDMVEKRVERSACGVSLASEVGEEIDYVFNPMKVTCENCRNTNYFDDVFANMKYK